MADAYCIRSAGLLSSRLAGSALVIALLHTTGSIGCGMDAGGDTDYEAGSDPIECEHDSDCPNSRHCYLGERCRPECTSDRECEPGQICTAGACNDGCRVDEDCPGSICGRQGLCLDVPDPVPCGLVTCEARMYSFGEHSRGFASPCCVSADRWVCGYDVSFLELRELASCQARDQDGEPDSSCPPNYGYGAGPLQPCRASSGECGVWLEDEIGIRCAHAR
jgi:hypothetical protein